MAFIEILEKVVELHGFIGQECGPNLRPQNASAAAAAEINRKKYV
jgi:hypothetical protein